MAQAVPHDDGGQQLALHDRWMARVRRDSQQRRQGVAGDSAAQRAPAPAPLCAGCREKEARYGFREEDDDPAAERPRTLCFSCFRIEISRRQAVAARLAKGWNAEQAALPLEETLQQLTRRRRRAQIAARHALGV